MRGPQNARYTPAVTGDQSAEFTGIRVDSAGRRDVVIGVVTRDGKVLVCQRPEGKSFAGLWEFPGGKREGGETLEDCLRRELWEELALRVTPVGALPTIDHDYPRGRIRLHPFVCTDAGEEPKLLACRDARWVEPAELRDYQFPPANDALIQDVINYLQAAKSRG
jgi:mutator protein MutT